MSVVLCLIAAISLWKSPSSIQSTEPATVAGVFQDAASQTPIQIAHEGEVDGLLRDAPQRPVPEPEDFVEQPALNLSSALNSPADRVAPAEPSESESPPETEQAVTSESQITAEPDGTQPLIEGPATTVSRQTPAAADPLAGSKPAPSDASKTAPHDVAAEIASLKGQINELARTQLENQLAEIRHAEQLLTTHQSNRLLEALQREVDELKAERLAAAQLAAEVAQAEELAAPATTPTDEPPAQDSEPVVELGTMEDPPTGQDDSVAASADNRIRFSESADMPGRYDVEADEATLQNFVATLGPVAGWNLVSGPELTGNVTLRWSRVDLRQALTQQLKARGWRIREDGEFAIIESATSSSTRHVTAEAPPQEEADETLEAPITLKLAPASNEGSTYDKSTGILIQPGTTSRSVPVSRTRTLPAPNAKTPAQPPVQTISSPPPTSAIHEPASDPAPLLMNAAPAPAATHISERAAVATPAQENVPVQALAPAPLPLPLQKPLSASTEMTSVEATPNDLVSHSAKVDIDVTIIEMLTPQRPEQSLLSQAISATGSEPCPTCGQNHSADEAPLGHASDGWFQMNEGIRCGVCSMTPDRVITRLQEVSQATVTATPHAQVLSRQVAEIGLTEKQGFRRINIRQTGELDHYEMLQGGVELALRPTLEASGDIRLDLTPINTTAGGSAESAKTSSPSTASLTIPPGSCAVIGGMYFGIEQATDAVSQTKRIGSMLTGKFADRDIREVVIIVRVQPSSSTAVDATPVSLTVESVTEAPAPLLIPAMTSPILK